MHIVAVTNIKGGVGKTTTCVNLAYLCAASGKHTLLWDLDPQGAATYTLRCDSTERVAAKKLVSGKRELPDAITGSPYDHLDLLPSDLSYRNFDIHLSKRNYPTERLLRMSRSLSGAYATMFMDCPPGLSLLSENVLRAADVIVAPLIPTPLSVRMLVQMKDFLADTGWTDVKLLPFFSMVDRRKALHLDVIASTRTQFPSLLVTEVPYSSEIERMSVRREPIPSYAPRSAAGQIYAALWAEIAAHMPTLGASRVVSASNPSIHADADQDTPSVANP
jgi:cellulose biosynthesis protein BcsQ